MKFLKLSLLLLLLLPATAYALGASCDMQKQVTFYMVTAVTSIIAVIGLIVFAVKLKKYLNNKNSELEKPKKFPTIALVIVGLFLAVSIFAIVDILTDGPISRRTNACILGFGVHTSTNATELNIDSFTNKSEVENLYNLIKRNSTPSSECIHLGTDEKHIVFEQTYCDWVEDEYPYFYNADGSRSYLSKKTLNSMAWDQRNLLEYFGIVQSSSNTNSSAIQSSETETYTNTEYGFSLHYPSDWELVNQNGDYGRIVGFKDKTTNAADPTWSAILVSYSDNPDNLSICDFYKKRSQQATDIEIPDYCAELEYSDMTIDGRSAIQFPLISGVIGNKLTAIKKGDKIFTITMGLDNSRDDEAYQTILDSFIFSVDTSDWQTYTNNDLGFSIKHPSDWQVDTERSNSSTVVFSNNQSQGEGRESIQVTTTDQTITDWLSDFDASIIQSTSDTVIAGNIAKRVNTTEFALDYVAVRNAGKLYVFTSNGGANGMFENGMLSTVTFLSDTSDWQTYTNDTLGIQFQYPTTGNVSAVTLDESTAPINRYPTTGKAISITVSFSEESKIYVIGSSSDFSRIYTEPYNGGEDLSAICTNPGEIQGTSYCSNTTFAGQSTYKKVYFQAPECSPMFVQETKLNYDYNGYAGIRISQTLFTDGEWNCTSPSEEFDTITNSEINRLFTGTNLTEKEQQQFDDFNQFLSTFQFTTNTI